MGETFKDCFLQGICTFDKIDRYIEDWHTQLSNDTTLRDSLGFSEEEYQFFLTHGNCETALMLMKREEM